ncbi:DNA-directed RNA polymerase subunit beta [bacterium]|nr:DNA-directed RNA polymerase subunit beta [bacterium]MBT6131289.1 DNA-directed RNA polymerase subunit beta [bacterium]
MGKGIPRRSFGKIKDIVPVPNLIEVQSKSFNDFVQLDYLPEERSMIGLQKAFRDIFPIDYGDKMSLEFVSYELGNWTCTCGKLTGVHARYTWSCGSCDASGCSRLNQNFECPECKAEAARYRVCSDCFSRVTVNLALSLEECRAGGQTFSMPLRVKIQLVSWDNSNPGERVVRDIKEQDIFFVDIPVMANLYDDKGRFRLGSLGTFLINGVDRVIVSQLHRSPGVVYSHSKKVKDLRGRPYYLARIIPMRGSWIDFEYDSSDILYVRIDKKKKILATTFLQALGIARDQIIPSFYDLDTFLVNKKGKLDIEVGASLLGWRLDKDILPKKAAALAGKRITNDVIKRLKKLEIKKVVVGVEMIVGRVCARDIVNPETGEIVVLQGSQLNQENLELISAMPGLSFGLVKSSGYVLQPTLALTLSQDKAMNQDEALRDIHAKIWPGDTSSLKDLKDKLRASLYDPRMYDLTRVGRTRMNRKLGLNIDQSVTVLTQEDIIASMRYLVNMRERGEGELDDIDHLGNRRVRLVGELLNNQIYTGLVRIERIVRERFRIQEQHGALMPQDFLNVKPLSAVIREFFGTGQLSQFMDQTNPLAEIAHKRRLSALGPGGVMKDRATYEIRDVHTSHYGRICPIETPEGQTVGLISSLATYALVNDLGFIETAYHPVKNGKVLDDVVFLDAFEEAKRYIAQDDAIEPGKNQLKKGSVFVRHDANFVKSDTNRVDLIDVSPKQLVSVSTALIPFLEHDDASRALMGSNMQRQAVPIINTQPPIVGTGMEREIAVGSGAAIVARRPGVIDYVSSDRIVIAVDRDQFKNVDEWVSGAVDVYHLRTFERSSYDTWIHQSPIVKAGDRVQVGDVLSNGSAIRDGELALGSNLLVAFMPWHGYNFEDAIVLSQRLVSEDVLTSVHIDEYVVEARDTKLGPEEITRDMPNVSESALAGLDEDGIIRIGTRVMPGNILVGKVTLKGDVQFSPEEKLLRAIFGEKSREVRDTSMRVPSGVRGTVVDVKLFSRSGIRKDKRYKDIVAQETAKLDKEYQNHVRALQNGIRRHLINTISGKAVGPGVKAPLAKSKKFSQDGLETCAFEALLTLEALAKELNDELVNIRTMYTNQLRILEHLKEGKIARLKKGDPLPSGVIKMVKVYIAMKRPIRVGDKIAGRHGNKGVVSNIVPREDMPYLQDGTGIDIVLNPVGVPSRMNVGQILETILGFAGKQLGDKLQKLIDTKGHSEVKKFLSQSYSKEFVTTYEKDYGKDGLWELARETAKRGIHYKTPVFDGADFKEDIQPILETSDGSQSGCYTLYSGRTGKRLDQPVTVGYIYMMKLNHMVDDKLHARSVGPYSLVTQQPLGGKAQLGGQRLGEMEVWALEAYGAAYSLQEMLTYKSDDVSGRHKVYEAIVRGEDVPDPGLPESFNVLVKELQSLGLRLDLLKSGKEEVGD